MTQAEPGNVSEEFDPQAFDDGKAEASKEYGRFNLAIMGNSGVGKSSLVNAVFKRDLAKVGMGLPVTKGIDYYHDEKDTTLGIWDFEGFEIGSNEHPAKIIKGHLAAIAERPANEQISVVWYCVLWNAGRLTETDRALIQGLNEAGLPVVLVLTKTIWDKPLPFGKHKPHDDADKFQTWLQNPHEDDEQKTPIDLPVEHVILTTAHGRSAGQGISELVDATLELAPKNEKNAFRIAQRHSLPLKRDLARQAIALGSALSVTAAATPLPLADAATLAPIQLGMMGRISVIYDLELSAMVSGPVLAQLGIQMAGKAAARSLLKLVPGVGLVVNATVAGLLTAAAGEAWMRLCEKIVKGEIDLSNVEKVINQFTPGIVDLVKSVVEAKTCRV